jgi:excisionase family DNA binding protein
MPDTEKMFYTPSELQKLTGIYAEVIRKAVSEGELRAFRFSEGSTSKMRITLADFWEWANTKATVPAKEG